MTTRLTDEHLPFIVTRIPKDVRAMLKEHPIFLAGGFIRATILGERVADIDLLGPDKNQLDYLAKYIALERRGRVHTTDNAYTVLAPPRIPVQFITRWLYDDPEQLIHEFDFTIAQAVIWWDAERELWRSLCADTYYADLAARQLRYTRPERNEDAGGSLLRARKFVSKGYIITAPDLAKVIARLVMGVDLGRVLSHSDREGQLGKVLGGLLREVDPLMVIDGFDTVDEHELEDNEE